MAAEGSMRQGLQEMIWASKARECRERLSRYAQARELFAEAKDNFVAGDDMDGYGRALKRVMLARTSFHAELNRCVSGWGRRGRS